MHLTATITNISRGSLHDGPGIRTVVYLKGCGLRCRWCHNPETLSGGREIMYLQSKCIHCGRCVEVCPEHHLISGNDMVFNREGCIRCGKCADVCPANALVACGEMMTVQQLFDEVKKDQHYYAVSGGGVTLSGGECLLQSAFAGAILKRCKDAGIHTVIETALFVPWENIEEVLPYTDMFYTDLKVPDPEKHRACTGQDNKLILENLHRLLDTGAKVTVRIPLIPGINDSPEDMDAFGGIIQSLPVNGVELLRYNYLAESKYESVGMEYESFGTEAQSNDKMNALRDRLQSHVSGRVFFR